MVKSADHDPLLQVQKNGLQTSLLLVETNRRGGHRLGNLASGNNGFAGQLDDRVRQPAQHMAGRLLRRYRGPGMRNDQGLAGQRLQRPGRPLENEYPGKSRCHRECNQGPATKQERVGGGGCRHAGI